MLSRNIRIPLWHPNTVHAHTHKKRTSQNTWNASSFPDPRQIHLSCHSSVHCSSITWRRLPVPYKNWSHWRVIILGRWLSLCDRSTLPLIYWGRSVPRNCEEVIIDTIFLLFFPSSRPVGYYTERSTTPSGIIWVQLLFNVRHSALTDIDLSLIYSFSYGSSLYLMFLETLLQFPAPKGLWIALVSHLPSVRGGNE